LLGLFGVIRVTKVIRGGRIRGFRNIGGASDKTNGQAFIVNQVTVNVHVSVGVGVDQVIHRNNPVPTLYQPLTTLSNPLIL
jgi:hypothetical protein